MTEEIINKKANDDFLSHRYSTKIHRRKTVSVMVGDVAIGSDHPVSVQSMTNTLTTDVKATITLPRTRDATYRSHPRVAQVNTPFIFRN